MVTSITAILLMAGISKRSELGFNKCLYDYLDKPLFIHSLLTLIKYPFEKIILVINNVDLKQIKFYLDTFLDSDDLKRVIIKEGGETRSISVKNGLKAVLTSKVLIHDAARLNLTVNDCLLIDQQLDNVDGTSFYCDVVDTIKIVEDNQLKTLKRDNLRAITTPQGFRKSTYETIINNDIECLDELMVLEKHQSEKKFSIEIIKETHAHPKLTSSNDFEKLAYRIGHSFDFHPFDETKQLILGGVRFDHCGLKGHSDADVLYHTVAESIIGALGQGDLGTHYPDTDSLYKNMDSSFFVKGAKRLLGEYDIINIDSIIYLEEPNLKKVKKQMAQNIADLLEIDVSLINVKATTMEKKGVIGSKEGIASETIVMIKKIKSC